MPPPTKHRRDLLTGVPNRAGKARPAVNPPVSTHDGSMLVIDPKGELVTVTAGHRTEWLSQRVVVLDPFGVMSDQASSGSAGFGAIQVHTPNRSIQIENIGRSSPVVREMSSCDERHWDDCARAVIKGMLTTAAVTHPRRHRIDA